MSWQAYFEAEGGYPEARQDYRIGLLSALVFNFAQSWGKHPRFMGWEDFAAMHQRGIPLDSEKKFEPEPLYPTQDDLNAMNELVTNLNQGNIHY